MKLAFSELSLVLLVGPSGCGKSTFARRHFRSTEVISSDFFRGMVCDDEASQAASKDAFELVHALVARRLAWRRFTVVDATNLQPDARRPLLDLARKYHYLTAAIVFDLSEEACQRQNLQRPGRTVAERVINSHAQLLAKAVGALTHERVGRVYHLRSVEDVARATIERVPLDLDRRHDHGPLTSSATSTGASTNCSPCSRSSATRSAT